jgi:hypothetical protein
MARSISVIQQEIINNLVNRAAAVGITINPAEWSDYDYRQLLTYVAATGDATLEQLWDSFLADVQEQGDKVAPQTPTWLQAQMLKFQFDATDVQELAFDETTFAPAYPQTVAAYQVIKYCSVLRGAMGTTLIKVAADVAGLPSDLDTEYPGALASAQSYVNLIGIPGLVYTVVSGAADKLKVGATVYYRGAYSAVIQANVEAAITAYLTGLPFDGIVVVSDLEAAIKAVEGVNDVVLSNVKARPNATSYPGGVDLVAGTAILNRRYSTQAGYIIPETATGGTLADTITYIPE